jgi:hypothetical protein
MDARPNSPAADPNSTEKNAGIFIFGDIYTGTITEHTGNPHDTDQCEWSWGFIQDQSRANQFRHRGFSTAHWGRPPCIKDRPGP